MTRQITKEEAIKAVIELEDILRQGDVLRQKIEDKYDYQAVMLIGEIMALRETAREAAKAAEELFESCDNPDEDF